MTDNIKKSLKKRSKLTKIFYENGQGKTNHEKVLEKATECNNEIQAKENYILKMSKKFENSHSAPKAYWTILNSLILPLFVDGNLISDFCENEKFLITTLHQYVHQ